MTRPTSAKASRNLSAQTTLSAASATAFEAATQVTAPLSAPSPLADAAWLDCAEIEPSPFQPRLYFDEAQLAALTADIAAKGVDSPIAVRPIECNEGLTAAQIEAKKQRGIHYQIIFGERRWRAAMAAGQTRIPARVRRLGDLEAREKALKENVERNDLTDYEEAAATLAYWDAWKERAGREVSQNEMIRVFGKRVHNLKKLMEICEVADDLKPIAQRFGGVMTQVFEIGATQGELREQLISLFDVQKRQRASVGDVRSHIENYRAQQKAQRENWTAPDNETQTRGQRADEQGSAPVSRGRHLTGITKREATASAAQAAQNALSNLDTVEQWIEAGGAIPRDELLKLSRKVGGLLAS